VELLFQSKRASTGSREDTLSANAPPKTQKQVCVSLRRSAFGKTLHSLNSNDYELGAKPDPDDIRLDSPSRKHVSVTLPHLNASQTHPDLQMTNGAGHRRLASDSDEGADESTGVPTRTPRRSVSFSRLAQVHPHPSRTESPVPSISLDNTPGTSPYPSRLAAAPRRARESAIARRKSEAELDFDMEFDDAPEESGRASTMGIVSGVAMKEMSSDDVSGLVMIGGGGRHGRSRARRDSNVSWDEGS